MRSSFKNFNRWLAAFGVAAFLMVALLGRNENSEVDLNFEENISTLSISGSAGNYNAIRIESDGLTYCIYCGGSCGVSSCKNL